MNASSFPLKKENLINNENEVYTKDSFSLYLPPPIRNDVCRPSTRAWRKSE